VPLGPYLHLSPALYPFSFFSPFFSSFSPQHKCTFDFASNQQALLRAANPVVGGDKFGGDKL
jgi:hypothetical protein